MSVESLLRPKSPPPPADVRAAAAIGQQYLLVVAEGTLSCDGESDNTRSLSLSNNQTLYLLKPKGSSTEPIICRPLGIERLTDLAQVLREHLSKLDEADRATIIALTSQLMTHPTGHCTDLSNALRQIREALRQRLPSEEDPAAARGLCCEGIVSTGDGLFGIFGWAFDRGSPSIRLHAISPEGVRVNLVNKLQWHTHSEVDAARTSTDRLPQSAFFACFEAPAYSSAQGWLVELSDENGARLEARAPSMLVEPEAVAEAVLGQWVDGQPQTPVCGEPHILPILSRVQNRRMKAAEAHDVRDYGPLNDALDVSIVIPLFERPDLLEQQLMGLALDRDIASRAQIIYVLDSPWMAEEFAERSAQWCESFNISFRLVTMERRAGWAGATTVGCSHASGRRLLLMHSDVLPAQPGWLGEMLEHYEQKTAVGALGCRLLYPDHAIQHQGLTFARRGDRWRVRQPLKGLDAALFSEDVPRQVAAVSAACLLVDRALFHSVGGLCGEYPAGNYEDADLCVRLAQASRVNWYLSHVSLHHIEGQSGSKLLKDAAASYNAWLFTSRWGELLDRAGQSKGGAG